MQWLSILFNSAYLFIILCGMLIVLRDVFEATVQYEEGEEKEEEIEVLGLDDIPTGEMTKVTSVEVKLTPNEVCDLNYGQAVMIIARSTALGIFTLIYYFIFLPMFQ